MESEFEYYVIGRENNNSHPFLIPVENGDYEFEDESIEDPELMEYHLGAPIPRKSLLVDYHSTPYSVVSDKICTILEGLSIKGVQLIPAVIIGKQNEIHDNYWYLHIYNNIPALDKQKSVFKWNAFLEVASSIDKLVLSMDVLKEIPLKERLVFRLKENSTFGIFHQSVVKLIMESSPVGITFTLVDNWNMGVPFD